MEEELAAQRDAAIAVTRELQKQLQLERETMARTFERRALTAERLRLRAEVAQRRAASASSWERRACGRLLSLSLFLGAAGALVGWSFGLLALLMGLEPVLGFLLVLPGMAIGTLLGLAVAKTKAEMEERSRREQQEREDAHSEAEMAALDGEQPEKEEQDAAADDDAIKDQELQSWTAAGLGLAWRTTRTAVGLAAGLVSGSDPAQRVFQAPPPADADRKRQ